MNGMRLLVIFALAAVTTWVAAANSSSEQVVFSSGPWEAACLWMGLVLGMALINVRRLHQRLRQPGWHLVLGAALISAGFVGRLEAGWGSPVRTLAPILMMARLAWAMVALAGARDLHRQP